MATLPKYQVFFFLRLCKHFAIIECLKPAGCWRDICEKFLPTKAASCQTLETGLHSFSQVQRALFDVATGIFIAGKIPQL